MGFLDRMISDLIQDNTGINARRLVRRIGGGKIVALGGAALAAAALAEKKGFSGFGGGAAQPPGVAPQAPATGTPPPPPVPGSAGAAPPQPPPPPPIPGAAAPPTAPPTAPPEAAPEDASADDELPPELTYAIVRTMVGAALADGQLSPDEKAIIQKHLGDSGLSPEQTQQIHQDLVLPPSPDELAALAPAAEAREILFRFAALVVLADQEASDLERRWLDRLASAFELPEDRKAALETEIFAEGGDE